MAALPAIRINTQVPFPALVTGSGPITITKTNGVWQAGFSMAQIQSIVPPSTDFAVDGLFGFNARTGQFFQVTLTNLITILGLAAGAARAQRLATASPIVVSGTDQIINVNISTGAAACTLPTAASRGGAMLTFKDVGGHFASANLTITPAAGDTIDGAASLVLATNRQSVNLVPANDGTTTGWFIE